MSLTTEFHRGLLEDNTSLTFPHVFKLKLGGKAACLGGFHYFSEIILHVSNKRRKINFERCIIKFDRGRITTDLQICFCLSAFFTLKKLCFICSACQIKRRKAGSEKLRHPRSRSLSLEELKLEPNSTQSQDQSLLCSTTTPSPRKQLSWLRGCCLSQAARTTGSAFQRNLGVTAASLGKPAPCSGS